MTSSDRSRRPRGSIDRLASGALRVRVYAGRDPVTKRGHYLTETVPAGPRAAAEAEKVRTRFLSQVDDGRNPRTRATVNQLMDRYLEVLDVDESTRHTYMGYIDRHIRPVLGALPVGRVNGETLDSLYGQLRRCRLRCNGRTRGLVDHRVTGPHECTDRCRPHECRPLAASTVRQIHWILAGAFDRALRWRWVGVSPVEFAEPPVAPKPNPDPPTSEEAARILAEAWQDPAWGMLVWLAMTTGMRRGELCSLTRRHVDLDAAVLTVRSSVRGRKTTLRVKDTKTHQQRRIALDPETVTLLRQHLQAQDDVAAALGITLDAGAYLFSTDPDCTGAPLPDTVSQRYARMVTRLGIDTTLHRLRHYNATELLSAGVDLRTVAGRLGHAGGGATTLKVYAAWVSEADRSAAGTVARRLASQLPGRGTEQPG